MGEPFLDAKKQEKRKETIELTFYDSRSGEWKKNTTVHAYLSDSIEKPVKKAVNALEIKAGEISLITPQGTSVSTTNEGKKRTVKDVVETYGLSFGLITKDVLGIR